MKLTIAGRSLFL